MYIVPRQIKAAYAQVINGVSYTANQVLTPAQIKAIPKLSALLSSGRLTAVPDVYGRRGTMSRGKTPTSIPPVPLAAVAVSPTSSVAATPTVKVVAITITGGDSPYSVNWGDSSTSVLPSKTGTHTYATASTFTITVTGYNGDTCATSVTTS